MSQNQLTSQRTMMGENEGSRPTRGGLYVACLNDVVRGRGEMSADRLSVGRGHSRMSALLIIESVSWVWIWLFQHARRLRGSVTMPRAAEFKVAITTKSEGRPGT